MRLNYTDPARRIGPSILLKVMATDTVDIRTDVFYKSVGQNNNNSHIVSEMITGLIAAFGGNSGALDPTGKYTIGQRNGTSFTSSGYPNIDNLKNSDPNTNAGKPKAYMNWILFDEQFNLVNSSSGTRQVNSSADVKGTMAELGKIMNTNGYLYVYLSNESPMDVFFDNFQVTHHRGRILEETHYYPFGLTMAGISSKALKVAYAENKKKFNQGTELDTDLDLNTYETTFRGYDQQIGRFHQLDPMGVLNPDISLYIFANNNPILLNDPSGLVSDSLNPVELKPVVIKTSKKKRQIAKEIDQFNETIAGLSKADQYSSAGKAYAAANSLSVEAYSAIMNGNDYPSDEDMEAGDDLAELIAYGIPIERVFAWGGKLITIIIEVGGRAETITKFIGPGLKLEGRLNKLVQHAHQWGIGEKGMAVTKGQIGQMEKLAKHIYKNATEIRQGTWANPVAGGFENALFYSNGKHIVVTRVDGTFVTILRNAMGNKNFNAATKIW